MNEKVAAGKLFIFEQKRGTQKTNGNKTQNATNRCKCTKLEGTDEKENRIDVFNVNIANSGYGGNGICGYVSCLWKFRR